MSYFWDRYERKVSHDRDESRSARIHAAGDCYGSHRMTPTAGGGVCGACGISIGKEEL
jgi:hypothetical protein